MAHLICHICCHMAHHQLEVLKKEEEAAREKSRKLSDRADKRKDEVNKIFIAAGKDVQVSSENQRKLNTLIQALETDNRDGLRPPNGDVQAIQEMISKKYKIWTDFSPNIRGAMLPEIRDLEERVSVYNTLDSRMQQSEKIASQLVGDPIHSLPYLFQKDLVTKDVALAALCMPSITREERGVMWDRYFPDSVKKDKEVIEASVERASVESCCCIFGDVPVWGKVHSERTKAERKAQCIWEQWCIPRIICLPCNAVDDCQTIQERSRWESSDVSARLIQ